MQRRRPDQRDAAGGARSFALQFCQVSCRKAPIFMLASIPQLEPAAVRGAGRAQRHFNPQVALVGEADLERGGLGDNRSIRAHAGRAGLRVPRLPYSSSATAATSRSPRKPHAGIGKRLGRRHRRRQPRLSYRRRRGRKACPSRTAPEKRLGHARRVHRIAVAVEHEGMASARARQPAQHRGAPRAPVRKSQPIARTPAATPAMKIGDFPAPPARPATSDGLMELIWTSRASVASV